VTLEEDAAAVAARVLRSAPRLGPVRLVCVDGPAGAGKTTLTAALVTDLEPLVGPVPVVHGDDVYEGWPVVAGSADRVDAFALLADRLEQWLLDPWRRGAVGAHPVWDWYAGSWGATRALPAAPVAILEGVGLGGTALRAQAVASVWVGTGADRLARVLARDGAELGEQMRGWQVDEQRWFERDGTRAGCTVRITT
jgi:uridine kinase